MGAAETLEQDAVVELEQGVAVASEQGAAVIQEEDEEDSPQVKDQALAMSSHCWVHLDRG